MTAMQLRPYQQAAEARIFQAWEFFRVVMSVMGTGGGKTVLFSSIVDKLAQRPVCVIAHRQELVGQISLSLARWGVEHRIVAPQAVIKFVIRQHIIELGRAYYNPRSKVAVAGVDTIVSRAKTPEFKRWLASIAYWVMDEGHHCLRANKWGKAVAMMPSAKGLLVTASPCRTDNKGLAAWNHGVAETLIEGPDTAELIRIGALTDYDVHIPLSDIKLTDDDIGASGDYKQAALSLASHESHIVGDIVENYLKYAPGKLGITFVSDVDTAKDTAERYRQAGVPAIALDANTPTVERADAIRKFRAGEIKNLVNVDLFGEGFDVPACEVVSLARKTASLALHLQQCGRGLRPFEGKDKAIFIDHVGNFISLGRPDISRIWSLEVEQKKPRAKRPDDDIPLIDCKFCTKAYEKYLSACPYCGREPERVPSSSPEVVEGDLSRVTKDQLDKLWREYQNHTQTPQQVAEKLRRSGAPLVAQLSAAKRHGERLESLNLLRDKMAHWGGVHHHNGLDDAEIQRKFWHLFGVDVLSAQIQSKSGTDELIRRIDEYEKQSVS